MTLPRSVAFVLAALAGCSCSSLDNQPERKVSEPTKPSQSRVRAAQELLGRCRVIEPRIPACDQLQAVVTRDDGVPGPEVPPPQTTSVDTAQPVDLKATSLTKLEQRATHARAMLAEIQATATSGMRELEDSEPGTRDAIAARLATLIARASREIVAVDPQLSPSARSSLLSPANDAASAVLSVKTWIRSRRPNAAMNASIDAAIVHFDSALVQIGTESLGQRKRPALIEREASEADSEVDRATLEAANLKNAITAELLSRHVDANRR